jgi:hypothetical protein
VAGGSDEEAVPVGGDGAPDRLVPYYAPLLLADYERDPGSPLWPTTHALIWAVLIGIVAIALWRRRVLIHQPVAA